MRIEELFSVRDKVVLVTGGSRGIGAMIADAFVRNGARVYISSRDASACEATAERLSQSGCCIALPADLADETQIDRLVRELQMREARLDCLVNNAGASWGAPFEDFPASGWDKVMTINVRSPFFLSQRLIRMLERPTGEALSTIINIASVHGHRTSPLEVYSYAAAKAAVIHLTRIMARHLAPRGIAINAIAPGLFESRMTGGLPEWVAWTRDHTPAGRIGRPEDIGAAALYLASRGGAFLCGATLAVDGGLSLTT